MTHEIVKRIIHCDWGVRDDKRATCVANRIGKKWKIETICNAGDTSTLFSRMLSGLKPDEGQPTTDQKRAHYFGLLGCKP